MSLITPVALAVIGLAAGSLVNAMVWRLREQHREHKKPSPDKKYLKSLSIVKGRSMCPHCKHALAAKDLVPVFSWLSLRGRCRYCGKPVSIQYPLVELVSATLFIASYVWWPVDISGVQTIVFSLWLVLLTGFLALLVYDLRWKIPPDRLIASLSGVAAVWAVVGIIAAPRPFVAVLNVLAAVMVGGGIFYVLYQVSGGKWIGGGDVK